MKYHIYGTVGCGYCIQAKRILEQKDLPFEYIDLSELDGQEKSQLMEIAGIPFRTVPQIFTINEDDQLNYVGGFTELKASL
jgi:glutaredoxin 1